MTKKILLVLAILVATLMTPMVAQAHHRCGHVRPTPGYCKPQVTPSPTTSPTPSPAPPANNSAAPAPGGYFRNTHPYGNPTALPNDCASRITRSSWEPRPANAKRNNYLVDPVAARQSLADHPRSTFGTYDTRWDTWLLPRVDGQFTGTTDEIFQWAACKWGLPDNLLRAVAFRESTWHQFLTYGGTQRPVMYYGSGDLTPSGRDESVYADTITRSGGVDYREFYGYGRAPRTFSIMGVMSYDGWRTDWADQTNGTFPFNRNSTAFAVDYLGAELRGCYEGWKFWLRDVGTGTYGPGDMYGCVGAWYSGSWHTEAGNAYADNVYASVNERPWLEGWFYTHMPPCDDNYGCPGPDPGFPGGE